MRRRASTPTKISVSTIERNSATGLEIFPHKPGRGMGKTSNTTTHFRGRMEIFDYYGSFLRFSSSELFLLVVEVIIQCFEACTRATKTKDSRQACSLNFMHHFSSRLTGLNFPISTDDKIHPANRAIPVTWLI